MDLLQQLLNHKENLDSFVKYLPCCIHINNTEDFRVLYLDPHTKALFDNKDQDALNEALKTLSVVHPEDLEKAKESCRYYLEHIDEFSTVSFLQRLRFKDGNYKTYYTTGMLVEALGGLLHFSVDVEQALSQEHEIDEILEETKFIKANFIRFKQLTSRERDFITLWVKDLSNADIAQKMSLTESTVKTYKKRIYKKLAINSYQELYTYASAFDLI